MTPAGGGGAGAVGAAPLPYTLLSLSRYAQLIGINPAHFWTAANVAVMPYTDCCSDIWFQHDWQFSSRVSRETLAHAILGAERDIAGVIGYWPAPVWISEEVQAYPRVHRPDLVQYGGLDGRGYAKALRADYAKLIAPGQRAVTLIGTPAVVYSDEDGDGYDETATVSIATALTDAREVKVYTAGQGGWMDWEIRPARTKRISAGTFTATFWAWQLIDPDLWAALTTTAEPVPIDWNVPANLVSNVDVYREFDDTTEISATFYWEPETAALNWLNTLCTCGGSGTCAACALTTQNGCLHVRDANAGMLVPWPATYSADDAAWAGAAWSMCRDPDFVKLWYYAGAIDDLYLNSHSFDPLSNYWAQTIAWLATARLDRPFCNCDRVADMVKHLQADMAMVGGPTSYNATLEQLNCPWGTRRGAILAWERVSKLLTKRARVAVI